MKEIGHTTRIWIVLFVWIFSPLIGRAQQADIPPDLLVYPELIVYNAKIVTMDDYDINPQCGANLRGHGGP